MNANEKGNGMANYFESMENPFLLDIEDKPEYSNDDLVLIQKKLEAKNIDAFLHALRTETLGVPFHDILDRCNRGLRQKIITISENPSRTLFKIGNGGDGKNCIVCCTPLGTDRHGLSQSVEKSLIDVGFNGHFYLMNGGFPNPTGTEMKYAGVPYCFKIFMMLEAQKLGFDKVIWIDSACYAVNNPQRLFDLLDEDDAIFRSFPPNCFETNRCEYYVLTKTIELLCKRMGRDIRYDPSVITIVLGLKMNSPRIMGVVKEYYEMVRLGLPFLSCFPEEIVLSTIFNNPEYKYLFYSRDEARRLFVHDCYMDKDTAKNAGFYFVQRSHF